MKRKYVISLVGFFCFYTMSAGVSDVIKGAFDFSTSLLSTAIDTFGDGISVTNALNTTLRQGFKIHASITGQDPFSKLNGPLGDDFKLQPALQEAYADHTQRDAQVRISSTLCKQEENFVAQRLVLAHDSFKELAKDYGISTSKLSSSNMPRIALCASGGGCRAMLATAGFLDVLGNITSASGAKLIDLALYIAVLSGSTWATIPRSFGLGEKKCFQAYEKYVQLTPDIFSKKGKQEHAQLPPSPSVSQEIVLASDTKSIVVSKQASLSSSLSLSECMNLTKYLPPDKVYLVPQATADPDHNLYDEMSYIQQMIMLKFYGDQSINAMSPYGAFLSHILGAPFDDPSLNKIEDGQPVNDYYGQPRQRLFFSQAASYLEKNNCGNFPLPLASAIAPRRQQTFARKMINTLTRQSLQEEFQWFEFSPYEVGTVYKSTGAFVPTWAFGRKFYKVPEYKTVEVDTLTYTTVEGVSQAGAAVSHGGLWNYESANIPSGRQGSSRRRVRLPHHTRSLVKKQVGTKFSSNKNENPVTPYSYISEYPVGDLLATFGSAFAVSPADIMRIYGMGDPTENHPYFTRVIKAMSKAFEFTPVGHGLFKAYNNFRLFPFSTFNFLQLLDDSPCTDKDLILVDAGLSCNIPFALVLRKERKVDVIIALDASAPVFSVDKNGNKTVDTLLGAQQWAAHNNILFPDVTNDSEYQKITTFDAKGRTSQDIFIFKGKGIAPTIIYIPFLDNPANKDSGFSVAQCMQGECSTFNFGYKPETIEHIKKHVYNTLNNEQAIKLILKAIADKIGARG